MRLDTAADAIYSCASATEQSFVLSGTFPASRGLWRFDSYAQLCETVYHLISDNRNIVAHVISREPPVSDHITSTSQSR